MSSKRWSRSKTLWFNGLMAVATAFEASLVVLQGEVRPYLYISIALVTALGNFVLRFISSTRLTRY